MYFSLINVFFSENWNFDFQNFVVKKSLRPPHFEKKVQWQFSWFRFCRKSCFCDNGKYWWHELHLNYSGIWQKLGVLRCYTTPFRIQLKSRKRLSYYLNTPSFGRQDMSILWASGFFPLAPNKIIGKIKSSKEYILKIFHI